MSREVCGICWCPYDEDTGACACEPEPKKQHMTDLRTVAQQALTILEAWKHKGMWGDWDGVTDALKAALVEDAMQKFADVNQELMAALAEPENWELRRLREELERCKQVCAATAEAWREEAAPMRPREEAARLIEKQLHWSHKCSREKGTQFHYGLQELRELMDFIYGGEPTEAECIRMLDKLQDNP